MSPEDTFFELLERRKAFAASSDTWIEQPHLIKDNVPFQGARKDTSLHHKPSPKARPIESSEDEIEF